MFAFIKGILHGTTETSAIVEANGIGYEVQIGPGQQHTLPELGEEIFLHLSFIIRENAQTLYGFLTPEQKQLFEVVLSISGIGPKIAIQLTGSLTPEAFQEAVRDNNVVVITKVPGIGKKTAQRLLLEIRDKLPKLALRDTPLSESAASAPSQLTRDAMSALVNLGYNQAIAQNALQKALHDNPEFPNLPALITASLQHI